MNYHDDMRLDVPTCLVMEQDVDEAEATGILDIDGNMIVRYYGRTPIGFIHHKEQDDDDDVVYQA